MRWSWHRTFGLRGRELFVSVDSSALLVPRLSADWVDTERLMLDLTVGNGNSDPLLSVAVELDVPRWLIDAVGL